YIVDIFFFFQAEDGIRVFHVTGVQTCALPISTANGKRNHGAAPSSGVRRARKRSHSATRRRPPASTTSCGNGRAGKRPLSTMPTDRKSVVLGKSGVLGASRSITQKI